MKIVHLCLSCFYIDNFSYQENELVAQNVKDGHEVLVIASTETYGLDRKLTYVKPETYIGSDGATVVRIPYRKFLPFRIMKKLRMHENVYKLLDDFQPELIIFHGLCSWELLTVAKYKKNHEVKLYIDSHTDANNSAHGFISKYFLHYLYYGTIARIASNMAEKILCVSIDTMKFAKTAYKIPENKLEFYPLGGKILSEEEYTMIRKNTRHSLNLTSEDILFVQSGKIDCKKKLLESLKAFIKTDNSHSKFFIIGALQDDIKIEAENLINSDHRIQFIGWKSPDELRSILCAADIYVQPGSQSATMQMSICCNCVVILDDIVSHKPFLDGNGWLVKNTIDLENAIFEASSLSTDKLHKMMGCSGLIANNLLDYRKLASRLYY